MTKEEAIKVLLESKSKDIVKTLQEWEEWNKRYFEAIDMAIEALNQGQSSDLISRQSAIKAIDDLPNLYNGYSDAYDKAYIIGVLEELPSAQKKGEWIEGKYRDTCSKCRCTYPKNIGFKNFCPNCGADMRKEVE